MALKNGLSITLLLQTAAKRDGRRIERIGFFNPLARGQEERLRLDLERVDYWTGVGAQISERVQNLVSQARSIPA